MDKIEPKLYECSICFRTPPLPIADMFLSDKPLEQSRSISKKDKSGLWLNLLCSSCKKEMNERLQSGLGPPIQIIDESDNEEDDDDEEDEEGDDDTNSKPVPVSN